MSANRSSPYDSRIELLAGIRIIHAQRILQLCNKQFRERELLIIIRGANPASLQWHGREKHMPKPPTFKGKTEEDGRVFDPQTGTYYYSDYDLQGVYELRSSSWQRYPVGNYIGAKALQERERRLRYNRHVSTGWAGKKTRTGSNGIGTAPQAVRSDDARAKRCSRLTILEYLNDFVCLEHGDPPMFQHGAQDDWRCPDGRPFADVPENDCFVAFEPNWKVEFLPNAEHLRCYYSRRPGLSWIYP